MGIFEDLVNDVAFIKIKVSGNGPVVQPPPPAAAGIDLALNQVVGIVPASTVVARFVAPIAGTYYLWAQVIARKASQDSFVVALDNEEAKIFDAAENKQSENLQWTVVNSRNNGAIDETPRRFAMTVGAHVITFAVREQGVELHALFISDALSVMPQGASLPQVPSQPPVVVPPPPIEIAPTGTDVWVSVAASVQNTNGDGSKERPWGLLQALTNPSIPPGTRIYLRGGIYPGRRIDPRQKGDLNCTLQGAADKPISVLSAPGEWAEIEGHLWPQCKHVWFRNFEIHGDAKRVSAAAQAWTPSDLFAAGIDCDTGGAYNKFLNLHVHDCNNNGVSVWRGQIGAEFADCLIYYNGWRGGDRAHGHGIYTQNLTSSPQIVFRNCCIFNNMFLGVQIYGQEDFVNNYLIEDCTIWGAGALAGERQPAMIIGAGHPAKNIKLVNNDVFGNWLSLGYQQNPQTANRDVTLSNNRLTGGVEFTSWQTVTAQNNTVVKPFYHRAETPRISALDNRIFSSPHEVGDLVAVKPSRYSKSATVVIYNFSKKENVKVSLSGLFADDEVVLARDVQSGEAVSGEARELLLPMTQVACRKPFGLAAPRHTAPEFGVFVVQTHGG